MEPKEIILKELDRCEQTHHAVYLKTEGDDPDWPTWYAHWLATLSDLPEALPLLQTESELTCLLVLLDQEYNTESPAIEWPEYYADRMLETWGGQENQQ